MTDIIAYYDQNAEAFIAGTVAVDFRKTQEKFLAFLPEKARILDFGCGSGRDAAYFHRKGYQVEAVDGSAKMCEFASRYAKVPVRQMLFQDLTEKDRYDGIWACSSILHLPLQELKEVMERMLQALRENGVIYTSFKYGEFEGVRRGRYFTDFTEESFGRFLEEFDGVRIRECWATGDVRQGRGGERWLNLILQKSDIH